MNWDAPTVTGKTWGERVAAIPEAVSPALPQERSVIRIKPSATFRAPTSCAAIFFVLHAQGCRHVDRLVPALRRQGFSGPLLRERDAMHRELRSSNLVDTLCQMPELRPELLAAFRKFNHGAPPTKTF
jgi:dihydroxy-acid dehydratase